MSCEIEALKHTPMMEQWQRCKEEAKDALLLFRMGDFYEAFYDDARILAEELELTLTKRQGIPMSGVPWHTCDSYIDRLVGKGYKVAIAEQTEDPKKAKGLVSRALVRIVTPGTIVSSSLLGEKSNNFIVALAQVGSVFGVASCDITTASFRAMEVESYEDLISELSRLNPSEIVISKKFKERQTSCLKEFRECVYAVLDEWHFDHQTAYLYLTKHFKVPHLDGFGLKGCPAAINAAGALLAYIQEELSLSVAHIREIRTYSTKEILLLDRICQQNLELTETCQKRDKGPTLLSILDHTRTPMGGRLLREWLKKPLLEVKEIELRQDAIEALITESSIRQDLQQDLKEVRDLERLMMKASAGFATPRDLAALRLSLERIKPIKEKTRAVSSQLLFQCSERLIDLSSLISELKRALVDEPPIRISEGRIFQEGYHAELDELRILMQGGKDWLAQYQARIKEETGIKNLKVSYNKIFGYYIEVSKGQAPLMPPSFERRQTLVNAERFISYELKEYAHKVLTAEDQATTLEQTLFQSLRSQVATYAKEVFETAHAIAQIDTLLALTSVAKKYGYVRPKVDLSSTLQIIEGRHPVVEATGEKATFIANDTFLDGTERLLLITGPNMAGKSTYIRQVALIVVLAQMGSFVPAKSAHIGVVDRIFTRIGANDDLARGQSTFMVEMSETANILNHITPRSLVILDEIGRGTSTYDGVAIAWAVAEYLLSKDAKALFATHYWELTELEKIIPGCVNYHAAVQEWNDEIVFLHKIIKGPADRSYGIHVARLAGLPLPVIQRATILLKKLEARKDQARRLKKESPESQLTLF
jgi:DNA mismatch repair protein MutS